jgi:hypothetical protein
VATFKEAADALTERATGADTMTAAATAMAAALVDVASLYLGGDLTLGGVGAATIDGSGETGTAHVATGGVYRLADAGRSTVRRAKARRWSALSTPWGPRANVSGSTWSGFGITDRAHDDVVEAGRNAIRGALK